MLLFIQSYIFCSTNHIYSSSTSSASELKLMYYRYFFYCKNNRQISFYNTEIIYCCRNTCLSTEQQLVALSASLCRQQINNDGIIGDQHVFTKKKSTMIHQLQLSQALTHLNRRLKVQLCRRLLHTLLNLFN